MPPSAAIPTPRKPHSPTISALRCNESSASADAEHNSMAKVNLCIAAMAVIAGADPAVAQLPPAPQIPAIEQPLPPGSKRIFTTIRIPSRPAPVPVVIHISPGGSDDGDGSAEHPLRSLLRARAAVRTFNRDHDVS